MNGGEIIQSVGVRKTPVRKVGRKRTRVDRRLPRDIYLERGLGATVVGVMRE